ncbi:uncharacterized protein CDAR_596471 [Caerostris darwini]|uniref:Uncharacterized protein n=1 Tax=Caerostris darwini TaxID=1538125 RepID=A0AAV4NN64_9ARAC|nr:uncharacterized protein CDAR_596471 [Caerostris darwini]
MGLQIHLIAIFAFFLQAILAARIVQPVQSFGIIGESSENFSERERIESNNARQYLNSVNIASKSIQEVDDHNKSTIVPHYVEKADFEVENGYSTLPSVPVVNGNKSAVVSDDVKKADSAIGSATTSSDLTGDLTQSSKITDQYSYHQLRNDQPLILNNDNRSESDNNKILNSTNIKSSTESPSDNSEPSSMMPIENGVNVEYSTVVYPTSTTKTEPKPTRIMTQREEMVSESVVKNKYQPMKTKSVKEESNSAKMNSIEDKWRDLEKTFRLYTDSVMKKALPKFLRIHSQLNISSQCNAALLQLVNGLRSFKSWAIKSKCFFILIVY